MRYVLKRMAYKHQRRWAPNAGALALLLLLAVPRAPLAALPTAPPLTAHAAAGDWTTYMGNVGHSGYNAAETVINPSSASSLQLQWTQTSGGLVTGQPIVANGIVYWGSWDGYERATTVRGSPV
jgi:hypothetical protein